MSAAVSPFEVLFPAWYDARAEFEAPSRGYLSDVEVRLDGGSRYKVYFVDPVRLQQTLQEDASGRPFFTEPGLVVLPEVSTAAIQKAVHALVQEGYFSHLKPIS